MPKEPIKIVIVGGGFGGVYALLHLHKLFHGNEKVEISMVNKKNYFLFTPLLHEVATGNINPINIVEPIRKILGCCLHNFVVGEVIKADLDNKKLETSEGTLEFDYLVLAPGADTNFYGIPGAEDNSFTLKTLDDAIKLKGHLIDMVDKASLEMDPGKRKEMLSFVIVGAGPTGVELTAEMEEFLRHTFSKYYKKEVIDDISIKLIQRGEEILPQLSKPLRGRGAKTLEKKGVEIFLNSSVKKVEGGMVELEDGRILKSKTIVWVAGVKPAYVPFLKEVACEVGGRVKVKDTLDLDCYPYVYAIGDVAGHKSEDGALSPMLAQVAVKQSSVVAHNIKNHMEGRTLKSFFYKSSGSFVSLGKWMAIGEVHGLKIYGHFAWFVWRTIYLSKLVSMRKKVKVAVDWTMNIFSARDISRL